MTLPRWAISWSTRSANAMGLRNAVLWSYLPYDNGRGSLLTLDDYSSNKTKFNARFANSCDSRLEYISIRDFAIKDDLSPPISKVVGVVIFNHNWNARDARSDAATALHASGIGGSDGENWGRQFAWTNKINEIYTGNIQRRAASSIFPVKSDGVPVSNQTTIINHAISDRSERILIPSYPSPIRLNQRCSAIDGLFQSLSLNTESNQLQGTDDSETSRQSDEPPIGRRFFFSLLLVVSGFFGSL